MGEILAVTAIVAAGLILNLAATDLRPIPMALTSPLVGAGLFVSVGTLELVLIDTAPPLMTLGLTLGIAVICGVVIGPFHHRRLGQVRVAVAGVALAAVTVIATGLRLIHLTWLTPDSIRYIIIADIMAEPAAIARILPADIVKRGTATSLLHTLGGFDGLGYSAAIGPLLWLAGTALAVWLLFDLLGRPGRKVAVAVGVFLATTNLYLYDAFYLNSHGFVAAAFLLVVAAGFMAGRGDQWLLLPAALAAPLLVAGRAEGGLLVALAIMPTLVNAGLSVAVRLAMLAPAVIVGLVWYLGPVAGAGDLGGLSIADPVIGMLVVMVGLVVLALVAGWRRLSGVVRLTPFLVVGLMTLVFAWYILEDPDTLSGTAASTGANLAIAGNWGVTWLVVGFLLSGAVLATRFDGQHFWTAPIAGYALLYWLLPYFRFGAYRIGAGDSGNRILAHILPVVLVYIGLAAGSEYHRDHATGAGPADSAHHSPSSASRIRAV